MSPVADPPEGVCPNCGMELPPVLLQAHIESCTGMTPDEYEEARQRAVERHPCSRKDDETDLEFFSLMEQLDVDPRTMVDVNVRLLNDAELSSRFSQVRQELMERGEMLNPTTQTGRDLHSERCAYLLELRRRGLLT